MIEELAVAIIVLDQAERFLIVHLMLFNLLNLVLLVLMKDIPLEVVLIFLEDVIVLAIVKERRNKFVEVLHMHELGIDLLQHLLVEGFFQDIFILLAKANCSWVHRFQGNAVRKLDQAAVFPVCLEDFEVVTLEEDYIWQMKLQSPGAT